MLNYGCKIIYNWTVEFTIVYLERLIIIYFCQLLTCLLLQESRSFADVDKQSNLLDIIAIV